MTEPLPAPRSLERRWWRLYAAPAAGILLVAACAAYFAFWFDPGEGIEWRPDLLAGIAVALAVSVFLGIVAEFEVLRAAGMRDRGFPAVFRVASIASLSTYLGAIGGVPARLALYRTMLRLPASTGTAALLYLTVIGTLVPAAIGVLFLGARFPKLALACAVVGVVVLALSASVVAGGRSRKLGGLADRLPAVTRRFRRFASETVATFGQFGRGITLRVALTVLLGQLAVGVQTRLMLELWGQSAPTFELTGVQAASYALGRISLLPLGLGVRDASLVSLMVQLGVSTDVAIAVAALDRGLGLGIRLLIGGVSLMTVRSGGRPLSEEVPLPSRRE